MKLLRCFTVTFILAGSALLFFSFPAADARCKKALRLSPIDDEDLVMKCSRRLRGRLASLSVSDTVTVWIFFVDRGSCGESRAGFIGDTGSISIRARRRIETRITFNRRPPGLPSVCPEYIGALRSHIKRLRNVSRYFNAVSAVVGTGEIGAICSYPFVKNVDEVAVYRRDSVPDVSRQAGSCLRSSVDDPLLGKYGESVYQIDQIRAIDLLELGYNGSGEKRGTPPVLVCLLDSGFNLEHEALENVKVLAEWDFVQGDSITSNEDGEHQDQDSHGTVVLGTIAGYHEGDLVGPAWGADYILAKTEIVEQEIRTEEDNWVAGIEWADSIGADVVSSSLGYIEWYTPDSLDGNTCLCTRAADIAASRGVVVVNSIGNYGFMGDTTLIAPADGDSVISVGAVYRNGDIVYFSSRGPTADGRTKPELVAMGYGVHSVKPFTVSDYGKHSGTSFAAPLVAGLCTLLLEIHPDWGAADVREALLSTATRRADPDNTYGFGIPRGLEASGIEAPEIPESVIFSRGYPNPFRDDIEFEIFLPVREPVTVRVYDCRGAHVRTLVRDRILKWGWVLTWDGMNDSGREVAGGVYFIVFTSLTMERTIKVLRVP